jgi:eukaryotic-like serine/threonine-protein kinase
MNDKSSAFGMDPGQMDRLLAWPLGSDAEGTPTASLEPFTEGPGAQIGRYKLLRLLGEGGMGIVYLAQQDHPIKRQVALKVIKPGMDSKRVLARFEAEEQALALMEHPHIARVYDAGLAPSGRPYFVMEYVKGLPIAEHCDKHRLTIEDRLHLFLNVCQAVQHAHQKGVIHRDLKPSNILVAVQDQEAVPKVIDFGVARAVSQPLTERTLFSEQGQLIGTPEYMSPEQADLSNQDIDTRTDVYSLGVILYELLAGVLPFDPQTFRTGGVEHIRKVICEEDPRTPSTRLSKTSAEESTESAHRRQTDIRTLERKLRGDLDWIVMKALEKDRRHRYGTVEGLVIDIEHHLNDEPVLARPPSKLYRFQKLVRRNKRVLETVAAVMAVLCAVSLLAAWYLHREARIRWAREELLPKIDGIIREQEGFADNVDAYKVAVEAEKVIPRDPQLAEFFKERAVKVSITTEPPGAIVHVKDYKTPNVPWEYVGVTPITDIRLPLAILCWRFEKEGYETVLAASTTFESERKLSERSSFSISRALDKKGTLPPGMVRVTVVDIPDGVHYPDFFIDTYEVTNRQFKEFVDAGGYQKQEYWKEPFVKEGVTLNWEDAIREFIDQTGRPGPATWQAGQYPAGQGDYPASGVSWYEAAAYAAWAHKSLPTTDHWDVARGARTAFIGGLVTGTGALISRLSNFGDRGPSPVGRHPALMPFGQYDMAGNVREWCWNESQNGRAVRGGAWNDSSYMFGEVSQAPAVDRSDKNGFRCVLLPEPEKVPQLCFGPLKLPEYPDFYKVQPVPNSVFEVYREQFSYDRTELGDKTEWKNESSKEWTQEKITFNAAYDSQRMVAYLFLPKRGIRPYQTVIYFPGSGSVAQRASTNLDTYWEFEWYLAPLVKSGRAVLYPVYLGTFERGSDELRTIHDGADTHQYSEFFIKVVKDFRRCIDYLQIRPDIDMQRLAYFGSSWGGKYGAIIPAVEDRLAASVLRVAGMGGPVRPEVSQINYIGRVKVPTLMLNGRYDMTFPYELTVKPMFDLLGTPPDKKELKLYSTDHYVPRNELIKETLVWLDRYLGPVK